MHRRASVARASIRIAHSPSRISQVDRRDKQLDMAAAVAASTKVKLKVTEETREFFETLMQEEPDADHQNLRLLIENQLETLRNKSGRCVWHVEVLDWCTDVYRRNPAAYEHMSKGGFLKLPHADTCRKRAARIQVSSGESPELYEALKKRLAGWPPERCELALLFDEINIVGDIAFKVINKEYIFFGLSTCLLCGGVRCMCGLPGPIR